MKHAKLGGRALLAAVAAGVALAGSELPPIEEASAAALEKFRERVLAPVQSPGQFDEAQRWLISAGLTEVRRTSPCEGYGVVLDRLQQHWREAGFHRDHETAAGALLQSDEPVCRSFIRDTRCLAYRSARAWTTVPSASGECLMRDVLRTCVHIGKQLDLCQTTQMRFADRWLLDVGRKIRLLDRNRDDLLDEIAKGPL